MRAVIRYYLKYTPEQIDNMSLTQLTEAFQDIVYVRSLRSKTEAEE